MDDEEVAELNSNTGPPLSAVNGSPASSNEIVMTVPGVPIPDSP